MWLLMGHLSEGLRGLRGPYGCALSLEESMH